MKNVKVTRKILWCAVVLCFCIQLPAQVQINNGAILSISENTPFMVKTMSVTNEGNVNQEGRLWIEGDIINNASLTCPNNPSAVIYVRDNWVNNAAFASGNSKVILYGGNQEIGGSNPTSFHRLELWGPTGTIKTMVSAVGVFDTLSLRNAELATQTNLLSLGSGQIPIQRSAGYISNQFGGKVISNLPSATTGNIEIPLGYSTADYKPITMINPAIGNYEFGLYGNNPTMNGLNEENLQDSLCSIQNEYFYWINASSTGLNYNLTMNGSDADLTKAAIWDGSKWTKITDSEVSGSAMQITQTANQSNYVTLAKERPFANAGDDIIMRSGSSVIINGSGYAPSTASISWNPDIDLSCSDCFTPTFTYGTPGKFALTIDNGPNCIATDTMELIYWREKVFIENAFSPNDDDLNDVFAPKLLANEKLTMMEVFNRWGEKIYTGLDGWDGKYNGEFVQQGLYIYHLTIDQFLTEGTKHIYNTKGTLTVLK